MVYFAGPRQTTFERTNPAGAGLPPVPCGYIRMNKPTTMMRLFTLLILLSTFQVADAQVFTEVTAQKGISHSYPGNAGGGVSFCDFTGDGLDDLTLATGDGETIRFYKNNNGSFELMPPLVPHQEEAKHVLWVDFDNDGDKDLYVATHIGVNRLYRNTGNLTFEDVTEQAGLPIEEHRTFGACWGDFDRDGWLDLFFTERKWPASQFINENRLFRNNADGTFTELTAECGAADYGKKPFCASFLDYNNDKWPDLYIANDKLTVNALLRNNGDGTFTDVSEETNADLEMDAMGIAIGDYDNDGWQDMYISDIDNGNELLHNLGPDSNGTVVYEEIAADAGVGYYGIAWGVNFFDADNDADLDLYVCGMLSGSGVISSLYYANNGDGTFSQPFAGFEGDTTSSFNQAIGDFNNDGFPDIMVVNTEPFASQLWQNGGTANNWVKFDLQGVLSNRDGVGTKIEVYTNGQYQQRYTHCGIAFMGQNSGTELVGLGGATQADSVIVTWPTGHVDRLYNIAAGERILIVEGMTTGGDITVDPDVTITVVPAREQLADYNLSLYPNPAGQVLNLKYEGQVPFTRFAISNLQGQIVYHGTLQGNAIPVAHLPEGAYTLILWNQKGEKMALKWVRN